MKSEAINELLAIANLYDNYHQFKLVQQWIDKYVIQIGHQYINTQEAIRHYKNDIENVREHQKKIIGNAIGEEIIKECSVHCQSMDQFGSVSDIYEVLALRNKSKEST